MKEIFSLYASKESIFKNPEILASAWVPSKILHRDEELQALGMALAPALKGFKANNIFIYGTVGTGKTITTRFVLHELEKAARQAKAGLRVVYINCKMKRVSDTEYRLLAQVLREFGVRMPETGLSTSTLYKKFFEVIGDRPVIIVLDEIDALVKKIGDEFLYNLSRADHKISLVGITNNMVWRDSLDARVKSSLAEEEIMFKPYNAGQLADILGHRAAEALAEGASEGIIAKCAAIAAQEHGDARRALELLRVAAETAERSGRSEIVEADVDFAIGKIDSDRLIEGLRAQPQQSLAVMAAVFKPGDKVSGPAWHDSRILSSDVYGRYRKTAAGAGLKVLTQRRVGDLLGELEALGIIETRVISKGRYGRCREIKVMLNETSTLKAQRVLAEKGF